MGSKDPVPTVTEWIKFPWEQKAVTPISQEDIDELQAEIDAINAANEAANAENTKSSEE